MKRLVYLTTLSSRKFLMTNSGNSPESPKQGFKLTVMQGVIGAVSLAGTTAIPLLVQRALNPPTLTPSPTQSVPAQVQSTPVTTGATSSQDLSNSGVPDDEDKGKGKKKGRKHQ